MMCMEYVQKHLWKEHLCALQVFLCALVSRPVCTRTQLRANIAMSSVVRYLIYTAVKSFVLLLLANSWSLVLLPQLVSVAQSPLLVLSPGMDYCWKCACRLGIMQIHSTNC